MPAERPRCGDCGALGAAGDDPSSWSVPAHFPDCPTLQEAKAGVEVVATGSHEAPRRCPKCGSTMTRNRDQQSGAVFDNCTGGVCGVTVEVKGPVCRGGDPTCPCQDGDVCHYQDDPVTGTPAWPAPAAVFDTIAAMPGAQVFEIPYPGEGAVCEMCRKPIDPERGKEYVQDGDRFYHRLPCWEDRKRDAEVDAIKELAQRFNEEKDQ